jgi:hypothetical protein
VPADAASANLWASPKMLVADRRTAPATWAALVQLLGEDNARYHLERSAATVTATPATLHKHWAVLVDVFGEEVRPAALTFNPPVVCLCVIAAGITAGIVMSNGSGLTSGGYIRIVSLIGGHARACGSQRAACMVRRMPELLLLTLNPELMLFVTKQLLPFVGEESKDARHLICQDPYTLIVGMHQQRSKERRYPARMRLPEGWDDAVLQRMVVSAPAMAISSGDWVRQNIAHLEELLGYAGMRQAVERDPYVTMVLPETRENAFAVLRVRMFLSD